MVGKDVYGKQTGDSHDLQRKQLDSDSDTQFGWLDSMHYSQSG